MAGGYKEKLSIKSPFKSAKTERWKPHPGQSIPVKYLNGQGIKKISALPMIKDKADKIWIDMICKLIKHFHHYSLLEFD